MLTEGYVVERSERIAALNDRLRQTLEGGMVVHTPGVEALGPEQLSRLDEKLRSFAAFNADNDPYGEHDYGSFDVDGRRVCFKVDYYDRRGRFASPDPADPERTLRVLTVLLPEEY